MNENNAPSILKLVTIITDRNRDKKLTEILCEERMEFPLMFSGIGSANSEILDMLGLTGSEKTVTMCIAPQFKALSLMNAVAERMDFKKPGKGIAFTVPLSGVSSTIQNMFGETITQFQEGWASEMEKNSGEIMKAGEQPAHDVIVAVINTGFSGELMDAAKAAGAGGGTIINAHRIGEGEIVKFFGLPIREEKELVAILVPRTNKKAVMQAIVQTCGMRTEAKGIVFSMHCDSVEGLTASSR